MALKSVENLVCGNAKKCGNHRAEREGVVQKFYYYWSCICEVNHSLKTFKVDESYGTQSTTRAVNDYRRSFLDMGYKEVAN